MSGKNLILFFISLFILLSAVSIKSQEGDSLYYTNPNSRIARELFKRKIVMLGDYGHHQPGVFKRVYGVLDNWLSICKSKESSTHLTYIIECDSSTVDGLNKYISTGDLKFLLDKIAPRFYLEDLEYFTRLKNFSLKIDSLNKSRKNKISFNVKGFEQVSYNYDIVANLDKKQHELWFINERDSATANGAINYIETHPDEQILLFYGTAHLNDKLANKKSIARLQLVTDEEGWGYFLAYYLKSKFGDSAVAVFNYYYGEIENPEFDHVKGLDFITTSKGVNDSLHLLDYWLVGHVDYLECIDASFVCSRFILEKSIERIAEAKKLLPGNVAKNNYYTNLYIISRITGHQFMNDTLLEQWSDKDNFEPTELLYSSRFDSSLFPMNQLVFEIQRFFSPYGIDISNDSIITFLMEWKNKHVPAVMHRVKFTNSIGIYWFGYPDERVKAKEYLVKFSGEDFAEPEKYLQWYRMKYYGYEF